MSDIGAFMVGGALFGALIGWYAGGTQGGALIAFSAFIVLLYGGLWLGGWE